MKKRFLQTSLLAAVLLLVLFSVSQGAEKKVYFQDTFTNLEYWRPVFFPKIKHHSAYQIETQGGVSSLKTESRRSASAIVCNKQFPFYDYPEIRWQWRVMKVYRKGNVHSKGGDDYPLRVYILFQFDPDKAGVMERIRYGFAKIIYGEYPPHSDLSYIWANRDDERGLTVPSPYSSQAMMIALQGGEINLGTWQEERVNVVDDYRRAFGSDPPAVGTIGLMNDSDNTGENAVSYIRLIEVSANGKAVPLLKR